MVLCCIQRWNAIGLLKITETGGHQGGQVYCKRAVSASAKAVVASNDNEGTTAAFTQFELDSFDLFGINSILKSWDPAGKWKLVRVTWSSLHAKAYKLD